MASRETSKKDTDGSWLNEASVSRRDFLRASGAGAFVLGASAVLAACGTSSGGSSTTTQTTGGGSSSTTTSTTSADTPKSGGNLRVGLGGGGTSDTLDPNHAITNTDIARAEQLFDSLTTYDATGAMQLSLAEEFSPNSDATLWTIRVPSGVTFHDGKTLGADDLIYSFQNIMSAKTPGTASAALPGLDVKNMRKLDATTIQVPFTAPYSAFPEVIAAYYAYVIPVGFDPKNPVGTGPFKYQSFSPGQQSIFTKFANYREAGKPYLDELTIIDFADETSQVNALLAGQIDGCSLSNASLISTVKNAGGEVQISQSGACLPIIMDTSTKPFDDVRVRQAMRLLVDRPQVDSLVFSGNGILGDDVLSRFDPAYDTSLPQRQQDVAQAKSLLKQAGQDGATFQMVVADVAPGAIDLVTVFAQQAKAAGVTISQKSITTTEFYGPNYGKWPFCIDYIYQQSYLAVAALSMAPASYYNETDWHDPQWGQIYAEAQKQTDQAKRYDLIHQLMMIDYERGGYVIPAFLPELDAHLTKVNGVVSSRLGIPFNNFDFKNLWISS